MTICITAIALSAIIVVIAVFYDREEYPDILWWYDLPIGTQCGLYRKVAPHHVVYTGMGFDSSWIPVDSVKIAVLREMYDAQ